MHAQPRAFPAGIDLGRVTGEPSYAIALQMHKANAEKFGNQAERIVTEAAERKIRAPRQEWELEHGKKAVTFARLKLSERNSVFDHHELLTEALRHSRGRTGLAQIQQQLESQKVAGELIEVRHVRPNAPLFRYTTPVLIENERYAIERVKAGRETVAPMTENVAFGRESILNDEQRKLVSDVAAARDQVIGIQGRAGVGKSTALRAINELAKESGFETHGLGPTSKAVAGLKEAGIDSETLQRFLIRTPEPVEKPRLFFVDESSLASGKQIRNFLERLGPRDRAVICGDDRQHDSVDAGRIFAEMQESGTMRTFTLSKIVRQQEPGLLKAVEALAAGDVSGGIDLLDKQGRITSIQHRAERFQAIAKDYAANPEGTLVVSPDNTSRRELNESIRKELRAAGKLGEDTYQLRILVNRQSITGEDRAVASSYQVGDVVRYRKGSAALGIKPKDYATVMASDPEVNIITVKREDGGVIRYNPAQLRGVSIYEPEMRSFAVGDRLQFSAPSRELGVSNRDMGSVSYIDAKGNIRIALDSGRTVGFNLGTNKHIDYSFATTSHASQGTTVDRVLVHIDTGDSRIRNLVTQPLAYVALSRPRYDARIFTDDAGELTRALDRHHAKTTALSGDQIREYGQAA
jgi:ATP-dependent exoDNAse (exonuclease V) alpha subunit